MGVVNDPFWNSDFKILFSEKRLSEFIPTGEMTTNEKLNSIVRFTFYYAGIMLVLTNNTQSFIVPLTALGITYLIHDKWGNSREHMENFKEQNIAMIGGERCVLPSKENPMANFLVTSDRDRPEACKTYDKPILNETANKNIIDSLYYDMTDSGNVKGIERQFMQMPNTKAVNDQTAFAQWCYGSPKTCKEGNSNACADNINKSLSGFSGGGGGFNSGSVSA